MTDSWAMKAIEDEAMRRAKQELVRDGGMSVAGLTLDQIIMLRRYYEEKEGRPAETIGRID